jgi:uncharacterized protein
MVMQKTVALIVLSAGLTACSEPAPVGALPAQPPTTTETGIERSDLRFPCGDSECAGWLYLPKGVDRPPVVVMAHGFAGTRDVALPFFAERFARDGIAAFVFDYRHFGASGGAPRQVVDPWRQLDDWKAALAFVRAHERVDAARVALWGTSLGGGLAVITGANDGNVRAVVAQAPQIDSAAEGEATFPGYWWVTRLLFTAWSDLLGSAFGSDPWMIPAIAPEGSFGMIVDDAAFASAGALNEPGTLYRNEVAARSIFTFDDYNPTVQGASIKVPVLLIASRADRFAPFSASASFAKTHPNVRLEEIGGDHFDIYSAPVADQAADLAAAFLADHLKPSP